MDKEDKIELYLKAYEEGLKDAWSDIESLISKYEGWELRSRTESKIGTLYQEVDSKRTELNEDPGMLTIGEDDGPGNGDDEPKISWTKGDAYLFIEKKPERSLDELVDVMRKGASALIIARESPDKLLDMHDIPEDGSKFIWLTRSKGENVGSDIKTIKRSPSDLSGLSNEIGNYMINNQNSVIFLSGIPLMTNYNDGSKVLKFLNFTRDKVTENEGCLVVSLSGSALEEKLLEKIKGEFDLTFG